MPFPILLSHLFCDMTFNIFFFWHIFMKLFVLSMPLFGLHCHTLNTSVFEDESGYVTALRTKHCPLHCVLAAAHRKKKTGAELSKCVIKHHALKVYRGQWCDRVSRAFLGAFAKLRKATICYMSVCLSVRLEQLGSHWSDFHEN